MKYAAMLCATLALFTAATGVMVLDMKTAVASMELLGYVPAISLRLPRLTSAP